jgi:hypothetical protein
MPERWDVQICYFSKVVPLIKRCERRIKLQLTEVLACVIRAPYIHGLYYGQLRVALFELRGYVQGVLRLER